MNAIPSLMNAPDVDLDSACRIRASDALYADMREFLEDEAALLDEEKLDDWLDLLTDDIRYRMPVRLGINRAAGDGFARRMFFYNDTKNALIMRIRRLLDTSSGWVEDPPSRIARIVSGVRIFSTDNRDEYVADSNVLLTRSRSDLGEVKMLIARRHDILRFTPNGIRLAGRDIYLNQTTIDMHNLAIFL